MKRKCVVMATYACADLHGCLDVWKQIQKFLKQDDTIYVLGDCGDRGPQPWETIKEVLKDSRAIYLKGNHEQMLIDVMEDYLIYGDFVYDSASLLFSNGGQETALGWLEEDYRRDWKNLIKNLPIYKIYTNSEGDKIYLTHAGFTPKLEQFGFKLPSEHDLLWDRKHFNDNWLGEENAYIIHGHTPVLFFNEPNNEIVYYCDGHKINLDCGTVFSSNHKIGILNLDTFDEHYFEG